LWERAGAWDGTPAPAAPIPDEHAKHQRITIADAVKVFLTNRINLHLSIINVLYSGWDPELRAKRKHLGTLRALFRFCMNREWRRKIRSGPT
ncbi:MAG: hypothetical protein ACRD9L_05300, partial [Bryobacteraceae bacterium]